jgi:hypothetical protein
MGCYFGAAIIALGAFSNDITGVAVGLAVAVVAAIAAQRYQSRTSYPEQIEVPIRPVRRRKPVRQRWLDWFGTPGALVRTYIWFSFVGLAVGIVVVVPVSILAIVISARI